PHITTIPIGFAVNLDRLKDQRQTSGGEEHVGSDLVSLENTEVAGSCVRRSDEQLDGIARADSVYIDNRMYVVAKRVEVGRIHFIWRQKTGEAASPKKDGFFVEFPFSEKTIKEGGTDWIICGELGRVRQKTIESLPPPCPPAVKIALKQRSSIH